MTETMERTTETEPPPQRHPYTVLVVDDESMTFDLVEDTLSGSYNVGYADSGEQALEQIRETTPDVVLLDVEMPGMNGLEVCRKIKADEALAQTIVIFISAADALEDRLKGYDAGGDDYIVKPFYSEELVTKVRIAIEKMEQAKSLKAEASTAFQTAMTALTSTGELGRVLQFLRHSFTCKSYEDVVDRVMETMAEYGLGAIVQVRGEFGVRHGSDKGTVTTLEEELLTRLAGQERIFDFGSRTAFNYPRISLLIKNMPLDDEEAYGRIKDNVALLVEGADARIASLDEGLKLKQQKMILKKMMEHSEGVLTSFKRQHAENKSKSIQVMDDLGARIEELFMTLGLTEEQEAALMDTVQQAVERALAVYEEGFKIEEQLEDFVEDVKTALRRY